MGMGTDMAYRNIELGKMNGELQKANCGLASMRTTQSDMTMDAERLKTLDLQLIERRAVLERHEVVLARGEAAAKQRSVELVIRGFEMTADQIHIGDAKDQVE